LKKKNKKKNNLSSCVLIDDKGHYSADYQLYLFALSQIKLEVLKMVNQLNYEEQIIKHKFQQFKITCSLNAIRVQLNNY